ncbi:MAG: TM2 domain-containing protein [Alphaproteobacteria bacterium]
MSAEMMQYDAQKKSAGLAYVLWFFAGWLGIHRFYCGKTKSGLLQLFAGVGALIVMIVSLAGGMGAAMSGDTAAADAAGGATGLAMLVWAGVAVWIFVDVFFVGRWVSRHNVALANRLGAAPA